MPRSSAGEHTAMRTLIVGHEARARASLRHLCEADANIHEVTVAECGTTALELIRTNRPDLLFLDVELKDMTGFEVLRSLDGAGWPAVIMVACKENHAVEAFRNGAIGYLTKPIGAREVAGAIEKAYQLYDLYRPGTHQQPKVILGHATRRRYPPVRLMAEKSHRLYFLAVESIDYIESCGNYVLIHIGDQKYVRRDTLKRLAAVLRELEFEWINRATLVNLARVSFAEKLGHGALAFTLTSGTRLVSKTRVKLEAMRI
jgi:two-component system, LytTR family, response regulator